MTLTQRVCAGKPTILGDVAQSRIGGTALFNNKVLNCTITKHYHVHWGAVGMVREGCKIKALLVGFLVAY